MKRLRIVTAIIGGLCLSIGFLAALSNTTMEDVMRLGNTLVVAGAILIGAALISSAILENKNK